MKKGFVISTLVLASLVVGGTAASAEVADTKDQKATVKLTENTDPSTSLLEITSASDLNFGSKAIGINDMNFTDDSATAPSIVVTDIRGNAPGWNLTVSLGEFKDASTSRTLKGVRLFYPTVTMSTNATVAVTERTPETLATDASFSDSSVKGILVDAAATPSAKTLINAAAGKGNGQWTATYDTAKAELNVPAGNLAGTYVADLTYTLNDAPTASN